MDPKIDTFWQLWQAGGGIVAAALGLAIAVHVVVRLMKPLASLTPSKIDDTVLKKADELLTDTEKVLGKK